MRIIHYDIYVYICRVPLNYEKQCCEKFATDLSLGELTFVVECGKFYSKNISQTIGKYIYYDY